MYIFLLCSNYNENVLIKEIQSQLLIIDHYILVVILQPRSSVVRPTDRVISWVIDKSNSLLLESATSGDLRSNDILSWCSYLLSTNRKISLAGDMTAITRAVLQELEVIAFKVCRDQCI